MDLSFTQKKSIRKNFGKLIEGLSIPNLIEVQKNSYNEFLSSKTFQEKTDELNKGIHKTFQSIFPIEDGSDKSTLEYISYKLENLSLSLSPKFDVLECKQRSLTYSASLKANLRLVVYDIDVENNTKQVLSAKEQEVFIGELPLMTPSGTFIVNGVERVVVNQMHRSPEFSLIMIKGKPTVVESYFLIVELFQEEDHGWILNLIQKIFYTLELIERKTSNYNFVICDWSY